jgi:hypothetical protein
MADFRNWRSMVTGLAAGILLATIAITLWARPAAGQKQSSQQFDTVSVHTLRIVDEQGCPRLVIAAFLPNPVLGGKELPRSSPVVGIQFLDAEGNETGGLAIIDKVHGAALCYDYDTGEPGEAMCFTKAGDYKGVVMLDPHAAGGAFGVAGNARVELSLDKGTPRLALTDKNGKDRIVLSVDANGNPLIQTIDANGKPVGTLPKQ